MLGVEPAGEQPVLQRLGLAPPPTRWDGQTLASDAAHHLVYALAASFTYGLLDGDRG